MKNLNAILVTVLSLVVVFWLVIFGVEYQKVSEELVVLSVDEEKECKEKIMNLKDYQLAEQISSIKNLEVDPYLVRPRTREDFDKVIIAQETIAEYLICKNQPKSSEEKSYQIAKDFIEKEIEGDQKYLEWLELVNGGSYFNYIDIIALGDFKRYCPNELIQICEASLEDIEIESQELSSRCGFLCDINETFFDDKNELKKNIIELRDKNEAVDVYRSRYRIWVALSYNFGGGELADFVCNNIDASEKGLCQDVIKRFNYWENCNFFKRDLSELICGD